MARHDTVWQEAELVRRFVDDVRGGVPYAADQIEIMLRVVVAASVPVRRFVDLGCGAGVLTRAALAHYRDAEAVLVDFSEPMLAEARAALATNRPAPRLRRGGAPSWKPRPPSPGAANSAYLDDRTRAKTICIGRISRVSGLSIRPSVSSVTAPRSAPSCPSPSTTGDVAACWRISN